MPITLPTEYELIAHYLYPLFGGSAEELLKRILGFKNTEEKLAFVADTHTTYLADLRSLKYQYPPDEETQKIIDDILETCFPPYYLDIANRAQSLLKKAEFIEKYIEELKTKNWSSRYKAIGLLTKLQQSYLEALEAAKGEECSYRVGDAISLPWGQVYHHIDQETARKVSSTTIKGDNFKEIKTGMHFVTAENGVHYKVPKLFDPNTMQFKYLNCGLEYASIVLQFILGSPKNVAFTTLMYLRGIPTISPRDSEAYKYNDSLIQASLTIEGVSFKDFLALVQLLEIWRKHLSEEDFDYVLTDAKDDFIKTRSYFVENFPDMVGIKEKCKILQQEIDQICESYPDIQFRDVRQYKKCSEERRHAEFYESVMHYIRSGDRIEDVCVLIGLIKQFPILMKGKDILDLLNEIKTIRMLFKLFPKLSAVAAYEETKNLMSSSSFIDTLSDAVLISLIHLFGDGKSENVFITIEHNEEGRMRSCHFVRFDNDDNLLLPFSLEEINRERRICLRVRDIVFLLPFMKTPVSARFKERLFNISPTYEILKWLSILALQNVIYTSWCGHVPQEVLRNFGVPIILSKPVIALIKQQWQALQGFVKKNPEVTYEDCLKELYPAIWVAYHSLQVGDFLQKMPNLPEDCSPTLAFEAILYKYFSFGYCDLRKLITEQILATEEVQNAVQQDMQSLLQSAARQCSDSDMEPIEPIGYCLSELRQMNWVELEPETAWQYVKIFSILPLDIAKQQHWQGETNVTDMNCFFQEWFNRAIIEGNPLVAYRMLQLGAKLNAVNINTTITPLHVFCRNCLNYSNYETAELMARIFFADPTCQFNHHSIEGPPIFALIYPNFNFYELSDMQKKIARFVLLCFYECGANLQVINFVNHTILDKALREIISIKEQSLNPDEQIETWFVELVQVGAIAINEEEMVDFYQSDIGSKKIKHVKDLEEAIEKLKIYNAKLQFLFNLEGLRKSLSSTSKLAASSMYHAKARRSMSLTSETHLFDSRIGPGEERQISWFISPMRSTTSYILALTEETQREINKSINAKYGYWQVALDNTALKIQNVLNLERLGEELAADIFCNLIVKGLIIPRRAFIMYMKKERTAVWVVSTVAMENLHHYLENRAETLHSTSPHKRRSKIVSTHNIHASHNIDDDIIFPFPLPRINDYFHKDTLDLEPFFLSIQIVVDIILGPQNNVPENFCIIDLISINKKYRSVVRIYHDNTFSLLNNGDSREFTPLSILFCLPHMQENIPSAIIELLLGKLDGLLKAWVQELYPYDESFKILFSEKDRDQVNYEPLKSSSSFNRKSSVFPSGFYFRPGFIGRFLKHLQNLEKELRKNPNRTHLSLLNTIWPSCEVYREAFRRYPGPYQTLERFYYVQKSIKLRDNVSFSVGVTEGINLKDALNETKNEERIKLILEQLRSGSISILKTLSSSTMQKELFNKIFSSNETQQTISEKKLEEILNIYIEEWKISFSELNIECHILTDTHLRELLALSPELTSLTLSNCFKLTDAVFNFIEKLDKLSFIKFTKFYKFREIHIKNSSLQECYVTDNLGLEHITVDAAILARGEFSRNHMLCEINLNTPKVSSLNFSDCRNLTDKNLIEILKNCLFVEYLKITNTAVESYILHHISLHCSSLLPHINRQELTEKTDRLKEWLLAREIKISDSEFENLDLAIEMIAIILEEKIILERLIIDFNRGLNNAQKYKLIAILEKGIKKIGHLDLTAIKLSKTLWKNLQEILQLGELLETIKVSVSEQGVFPSFQSYLQSHSRMYSLEVQCAAHKIDWAQRARELFKLKQSQGIWDFSASSVTDTDIPLIASLLTDNTDTFFCSFAGIALSSEKLRMLLEGLNNNSTLQLLDLHGCSLQRDSISCLNSFLSRTNTIFFINLDLNFYSDKDIEIILQQLVKKHTGIPFKTRQYLEYSMSSAYNSPNSHGGFFSMHEMSMRLYARNQAENDWPMSVPISNCTNDFPEFKSRTLASYVEPIRAIVYLFGNHIAAASGSTIIIFDVSTATLICTLAGHKGIITTLVYLKDGFFISGAKDNDIIIWSKEKEQCVILKTLKAHKKPITAILIVNNTIASAAEDGVIKFWHVENILNFSDDSASFYTAIVGENIFATKITSISVDGIILLITGCNNGSIQIWREEIAGRQRSYKKIQSLSTHKGKILALLALDSGKFIAADCYGNITVWEYNNGKKGFDQKRILMDQSFEPIFTFFSLPSFFSTNITFISGGVGGINIWKNYKPQCLISYIYPVNVAIQLPTGQFVVGAYDIRVLDNIFCQEEKLLDISFVKECGAVSVIQNKCLITVIFENTEIAEKEYLLLQNFLENLLYNCYTKNAEFDEIKKIISIENRSLYIRCPNEDFAINVSHCLFALFKPRNMIKSFLEKTESIKLEKPRGVSSGSLLLSLPKQPLSSPLLLSSPIDDISSSSNASCTASSSLKMSQNLSSSFSENLRFSMFTRKKTSSAEQKSERTKRKVLIPKLPALLSISSSSSSSSLAGSRPENLSVSCDTLPSTNPNLSSSNITFLSGSRPSSLTTTSTSVGNSPVIGRRAPHSSKQG